MTSINDENDCQSKWSSLSDASYVLEDANSPFCNISWDGILCWPLIPANRTIRLLCPLVPLFHQKGAYAERHCRHKSYPTNGPGGQSTLVAWSDYAQCFNFEGITSNGKGLSSNGIRQNGQEWTYETADTETGLMESVAAIEHGSGQMEIVGLLISILALSITIFVLHRFSRLHLSENMTRLYVLASSLILSIIKAIVILDLANTSGSALSVHTRGWCEVWYFLLEFFKSCLNFWFFFRCTALFCAIIISYRYRRAPKNCPYLFLGWLAPIAASITWLARLVIGKYPTSTNAACPELYYHTVEYWSVLIPQSATLLLSIFLLLLGIVLIYRHLHRTRSEIHVGDGPLLQDDHRSVFPQADAMLSVSTMSSTASILTGLRRLKWQLLIEFVILILLIIPFALDMFFYAPTIYNLHLVASLNYSATFFSMFQGLFISLLYAFAQISIPVHTHKNSVVLQKYQTYKFNE